MSYYFYYLLQFIYTYTYLSDVCVRALPKGRHEEDAYHHHHHQQHQQQHHHHQSPLLCARRFACCEETGVVATNSSSSSSPFSGEEEEEEEGLQRSSRAANMTTTEEEETPVTFVTGNAETGRGGTHPRLFVFRVVFGALDQVHRLSSFLTSGPWAHPERYRQRSVLAGVERDGKYRS